MDTKKTGKLYLIPCDMGEQDINRLFPSFNFSILSNITYFIVENARTARRSIKKMCPSISIDSLQIFEINKHNPSENISQFIAPLTQGNNIGILSEAGMPCIADPGNIFVAKAHTIGAQVIPLIGPNSILLSIISSGFNGQNFTFHGYIPIKEKRNQFIQNIEIQAIKYGYTQIFMETPYRNQKLLDDLLSILKPSTKLCIACDITLDDETIQTKTIQEWKNSIPNIDKKPCVFLIGN